MDAFFWHFWVPNKSSTLSVLTLNHWNDHWIISVEMSISNTISAVKLIWRFPFTPEKNYFKKKLLTTHFFFKLCLKISRCAVLLYDEFRLDMKLRNVTNYDFRQVHLESMENVILSQRKISDWLYCRNCVIFLSRKTDHWMSLYLQPDID